jgi:hypothetical protein
VGGIISAGQRLRSSSLLDVTRRYECRPRES